MTKDRQKKVAWHHYSIAASVLIYPEVDYFQKPWEDFNYVIRIYFSAMGSGSIIEYHIIFPIEVRFLCKKNLQAIYKNFHLMSS